MKLDARRVEAFLANPGATRVVLFHGEDEGLIREWAAQLVRTVAGSASGWTTSAALTVKATLFADIASAQLQLSSVNLQKYIKARDPSAPVDGLVAWYSFDDMPAVPDGVAPTYRSNFATLDGWGCDE